jgi:hypothetical protein
LKKLSAAFNAVSFSTNWVTSLATAYITLFYIRIGRPLYPFNRSVFTYIPIFKLVVVVRFQVLRFHF